MYSVNTIFHTVPADSLSVFLTLSVVFPVVDPGKNRATFVKKNKYGKHLFHWLTRGRLYSSVLLVTCNSKSNVYAQHKRAPLTFECALTFDIQRFFNY